MSFSRWVCVWSRLAEDLVERALAEGVRQYVILGAGLDSFAYRRTDLLDRLRVFEVYQPASQKWKRRRLEDLSIELPKNLVFAAVDFETQSLMDCLGPDEARRDYFQNRADVLIAGAQRVLIGTVPQS